MFKTEALILNLNWQKTKAFLGVHAAQPNWHSLLLYLMLGCVFWEKSVWIFLTWNHMLWGSWLGPHPPSASCAMGMSQQNGLAIPDVPPILALPLAHLRIQRKFLMSSKLRGSSFCSNLADLVKGWIFEVIDRLFESDAGSVCDAAVFRLVIGTKAHGCVPPQFGCRSRRSQNTAIEAASLQENLMILVCFLYVYACFKDHSSSTGSFMRLPSPGCRLHFQVA